MRSDRRRRTLKGRTKSCPTQVAAVAHSPGRRSLDRRHSSASLSGPDTHASRLASARPLKQASRRSSRDRRLTATRSLTLRPSPPPKCPQLNLDRVEGHRANPSVAGVHLDDAVPLGLELEDLLRLRLRCSCDAGPLPRTALPCDPGRLRAHRVAATGEGNERDEDRSR